MAIHYYPLINKIIKTLHLRDRIATVHKPTWSTSEAFSKPFITVSREPGSGGAPIAKALAEKLGFELVDKQIIEDIAKSVRKRKKVIKGIDEKSRSAIQDIVHSILNTEYVDDLRYRKELVKVVLVYANKGHVVILGRGANFITPFAKGLHVRITAPYAVRVQRAIEHEGVSHSAAKKKIAEVEKERKDFIKQYFGHRIDKSNAYDLTINTEFMGIEDVRDIITEAFYHKFKRSFRYKALLKK